jgi:hypothetical protein
MMMTMLVSAILTVASVSSRSTDTKILQTTDQALLDAQGTGEHAVWARAMTLDSVYVDENGIIMSRDQFLKQLDPLPRNVSGAIHIKAYRVSYHDNVALVVHTDDEREVYHGQRLHATYITTETWYEESGAWKLALTHVYAVNKLPSPILLPASLLKEYVGCYRAARDLNYRIQLIDGGLTGGVTGHSPHPLLPELADVLFAPGQPRIRMIFQRDHVGRIIGYFSRREGEDVVWKRQAGGTCPV